MRARAQTDQKTTTYGQSVLSAFKRFADSLFGLCVGAGESEAALRNLCRPLYEKMGSMYQNRLCKLKRCVMFSLTYLDAHTHREDYAVVLLD